MPATLQESSRSSVTGTIEVSWTEETAIISLLLGPADGLLKCYGESHPTNLLLQCIYILLFPFLSGDKRMDYERTLKTPSLERAVSSWPTIWHFPVEVAPSIESVLCNSLVRKLQNAGNSESKLISFFKK